MRYVLLTGTSRNDYRLVICRQCIHRLPRHFQIFEPIRAIHTDNNEAVPTRGEYPVSDRPAFPEALFERDNADVGF